MSDTAKDPAIKLFGRRIAFLDDQATGRVEDGCDLAVIDHLSDTAEKDGCIEATSDVSKDQSNVEDLDRSNPDDTSDPKDVNNVEIQASCLNGKVITDSMTEQEHVDADASTQENVLKKPDNILPCPRCCSMDTKFCYYNNYNVNQPRHFCRNCQRYWTAGGTMRNVPVGAGRRKNKHSSSQFPQLTISSDGLSSPRVKNPCSNYSQLHSLVNSTLTNPFNGNGRAFKVSQDPFPCIPTTDALITERKGKAELNHVSCGEKINEPSCMSSMTTSNCMRKENSENTAQLDKAVLAGLPNGLTHVNPLQCYPIPTWAYPWNAGWGNFTGISSGQCATDMVYGQESGPKLVPWSPPAMLAAPAFCAPNMPYPFFPVSFWGCMPPWPNGTCNSPCQGVNGILSPSLSTSNSRFSCSNSPTLGKHSREAGPNAAEKKEKSLWVPKTLRIDDADETARSSIWETLGIKCDQNEPVAKGRIFKSFQPRTENEDQNNDTTQVLHANPAALSRSNTFQEST